MQECHLRQDVVRWYSPQLAAVSEVLGALEVLEVPQSLEMSRSLEVAVLEAEV